MRTSKRGSGTLRRASDSDLIIRSALCVLQASVEHLTLARVARERYAQDAERTLTIASALLTRATADPAMTTIPEWAGVLVQEASEVLLDELASDSIVLRLPLQRGVFGGERHDVSFGVRTGRVPTDPHLGAAFRGEGAPIRVGSTALRREIVKPKSMGIIGVFSIELFKRSTINIEDALRQWMTEDTALVLDGLFFGDEAGDDIRPPGIGNGLDAGDTAASSGNTPAQVDADIRARIAALLGHRMGRRPVWVMNTARFLGLAAVKTAAGTPLYPSLHESPPRLYNIPVEHGLTVSDSVATLVDAAELAHAMGIPQFASSGNATLHEEYVQQDVAAIVDGGGVVAAPVRSAFQTACSVLRGLWEVNWAVLRPGAVQTITNVTW